MVHELGPWYLLSRLRSLTGIISSSDGHPLATPDNHVLGCVWCTSIWVSLGLLLCPVIVLVVFAASAVAIVVEERITK